MSIKDIGYLFGVQISLNKKITTVSVLLIITFFLLAIPVEVYAQNTNLGVTILQLTPKTGTGTVGSQVNLQGTIYQSNGTYQVIFGKVVVDSGVAQGYYVNSNFTVPELPSGTYSLILRDESVNVNTSQSFSVSTAYLITPSSASLQEGDSVSLTVSVTGGQTGTSYSAAVSVVLPSPLSSNYVKTVSLGIPNDKGTVSATVTFPDSSFSPSGSLTDYAGTYTAYFNQSETLAQSNFAVNFIDKTTYHRGDTISFKATGYQPNTATTLTITSVSSGSTLDTASVTSSADGIISATRVVSSNFDVGDYVVRISAQSNAKAVQDAENFTIVGYAIKIETTNLAGQIVPSVSLQAKDSTTGTVTDALSDSNGIANFKLEKGTSVITAIWNGVSVGETSITVSGDGTFTVSCELINLKITVKNTAGIIMPYVDLKITYQYKSSSGTKTGDSVGQTDVSGSYTLISTLPTASYTIDASVYGKIFNAGNNTVTNLPTQATAQVFIIAPVETLTLNVVGFNQEAISGARIELVELSNGLFYSATTDSNGIASTKATFGMYRARIYQNNVLINETNVEVFDNSQQQIHCTLFGIQLTVTVVDFFGAPISNVNVTLNGPTIISAQTQGNGKATFNDIIGGNMQIIAQAKGIQDAYQAVTLTVNQPAELQIKIDKYIAIGSILIQASLLITILIILAGLISLLLVEVYLRRRSKSAAVNTN